MTDRCSKQTRASSTSKRRLRISKIRFSSTGSPHTVYTIIFWGRTAMILWVRFSQLDKSSKARRIWYQLGTISRPTGRANYTAKWYSHAYHTSLNSRITWIHLSVQSRMRTAHRSKDPQTCPCSVWFWQETSQEQKHFTFCSQFLSIYPATYHSAYFVVAL